jgi:hypothetical protein
MSSRPRSYGTRPATADRNYLQVCVRADVWAVVQQLREQHNLSISGAAHHLMRLGAGLPPLPPLDSHDT